jgi:hypothetical protein
MEMYLEFLRPSFDRPIGMPTPNRMNVTLGDGVYKKHTHTQTQSDERKPTHAQWQKNGGPTTYMPPTKNGHVSARPASVDTYSPTAMFCHADGSLTNAAVPATGPAVK